MNADASFNIGCTHTVCEDYALAGTDADRNPFAIVTDGCSGSPDTDVGARLVAKCLEHALHTDPASAGIEPAVHRASVVARDLGLDPAALDATVLLATIRNHAVHVHLAGDGILALKHDDGSVETWRVEFEHGAPAYPSYALDPIRQARYRKLTEDGRRTIVRGGGNGDTEQTEHHGITGDRFAIALDRLSVVALISDGATTFRRPRSADVAPIDPGSAATVDPHVVARELLAIKTSAGHFMTRRCRRFLGGYCRSHGWTHDDDLAIAAIWLGAGS